MTRLFARLGAGQHPISPREPHPLPANGATTSNVPTLSVAGAGILSGYQLLRRRALPGHYLRNVGSLALPTLAFLVAVEILDDEVCIRPTLVKEGIEPIRPPILDFNGKTTTDDFFMTGVISGLVAASFKRPFANITGWRRYVSLATIGGLSGFFLAHAYFGKEYRDAWEKRTLPALRAKIEKSLALHRRFPGDESTPDDAGPIVDPEGLDAVVPPMIRTPGAHDQIFGPGISPFFVGESGETLIDYAWEGKESGLRDCIQSLEQLKKTLVVEAEYLWLEIAKKEYMFYTEQEGTEMKETKARQLRVLEALHRHVYMEISRLDWLIANLKRNIRQLQAESHEWLPHQEHLSNPALHSPRYSAGYLRNALQKAWEKDSNLTASPGKRMHPAITGYKKEVEKEILVLDDLLRDFEKRVQDANNRSP
ncbi:hypothetical protein BU16DRAFT_615333 [Lophium mytilinum]|uniref:Uncharacterized protein n=1 Tax=Lophium mytilinum TaxID=390894 RepID=A0A6A6R159_9PEZI|nr:hypothetical protein BU16DRAFT_615333 [Lophium mytilinum]